MPTGPTVRRCITPHCTDQECFPPSLTASPSRDILSPDSCNIWGRATPGIGHSYNYLYLDQSVSQSCLTRSHYQISLSDPTPPSCQEKWAPSFPSPARRRRNGTISRSSRSCRSDLTSTARCLLPSGGDLRPSHNWKEKKLELYPGIYTGMRASARDFGNL